MARAEMTFTVKDIPEVKALVAHLTERAEKAEAAIERARALADVSGWHVYESRDTGDVYPADAVRDLMADIRSALDGTEAADDD